MAREVQSFEVETLKQVNEYNIVIPSKQGQLLLFLFPMILWVGCIGVGLALHNPMVATPGSKPVRHVMYWFDRRCLKPMGALLPLVVYASRLVVLYTPVLFSLRREQRLALGIKPTLVLPCATRYMALTLLRVLLYGLHLYFMQGSKEQLFSDHILLGASIVSILHSEIFCATSDLIKLIKISTFPLQEVGMAACLICGALLMHIFVSVDMMFTAMYFHHVLESVLALVMGFFAFQVPMLYFIYRRC